MISASAIRSDDVEIDGKALVELGGDFWHTPYPIGQHGGYLLRVVTAEPGMLESQLFSLSQRYLAYRLGGTGGRGVGFELRVPEASAEAARVEALDGADSDGYVAVRIANPAATDVLREASWDLAGDKAGGKSLLGATAKLRVRIDGRPRRERRLLLDYIRLIGRRPPTFRPPLWGWADIHCHPMAQAGFGDLLGGHMHGPVEDVGSCLALHGHDHGNILKPIAFATGEGRPNDGSLSVPGWTTGSPGADDELGFRGWPSFDDLTHMKTHQAWIRRAYDGGQRLMVALVVHNQMLAGLTNASSGNFSAQSDRDTLEPQVQMLREFAAHNGDWCGIARTPQEARTLIEQNRMAFVLGLETDSINGWIRFDQFVDDPSPPNRKLIHDAIHDYFAYLNDLGIVQVNLLHLSDNAFGGMAIYDFMFVVNSLQRTGQVPKTSGWAGTDPDEQVAKPVSVGSELWELVKPALAAAGIDVAPPTGVLPFGTGDVNSRGLTVAGEEALLEAMRLGMVVDTDHMSELSANGAWDIAGKTVPGKIYPIVAAHNGARKLAPRPLDKDANQPARPGARRGKHGWPTEAMKSETQLDRIKASKGIFGLGIAGGDSQSFGAVANDCPGSSKTFAQAFQYLLSRLELPVALGTDWNALLAGPGPRFGPRAANGLEAEVGEGDQAWADSVRAERLSDALAQQAGVLYDQPIRDWRTYRFADTKLFKGSTLVDRGQLLWQALALRESGTDLSLPSVVAALTSPAATEAPALDLAMGLTGMPAPRGSDYHRAGTVFAAIGAGQTIDLTAETIEVQQIIDGLGIVDALWTAMRTGTAPPIHRDTVGPMRDFDYNLDGLAHYGLLPDMLQDLINVGIGQPSMDWFFRSAEHYVDVWERGVAIGSRIAHP